MTVREYITDKFKAFGVTESLFYDIVANSGIAADTDISEYSAADLGQIMVLALEELILAPRQTSVSENGFSMSWDFANVGKYYKWLCRKYDLTPDPEVLGMLGLNSIVNRSNIW